MFDVRWYSIQDFSEETMQALRREIMKIESSGLMINDLQLSPNGSEYIVLITTRELAHVDPRRDRSQWGELVMPVASDGSVVGGRDELLETIRERVVERLSDPRERASARAELLASIAQAQRPGGVVVDYREPRPEYPLPFPVRGIGIEYGPEDQEINGDRSGLELGVADVGVDAGNDLGSSGVLPVSRAGEETRGRRNRPGRREREKARNLARSDSGLVDQ